LLRLADDFLELPPALLLLAGLGLVLSIAALFLLPPPLPTLPALLLVGYFVAGVLYAALAFMGAARQSTGVTRRRMEAIATGSIFLGLDVLLAGVQVVVPGLTAIVAGLAALCALACGVAYYLGFATPGILRRAWQGPELRAFLATAAGLAQVTDPAAVIKALEHGVALALGVPQADIGLWDDTIGVLRFGGGGAARSELRPGEMLAGRAFAAQRPLFSDDPARDDPANAERYRAARAAAVVAAPMSAGKHRVGVLVAYAARSPLFVTDDLSLVELLAQVAAVILDYARTYEAAGARSRAERERDRLRQVLEVIPEGVLVVDARGRIMTINPSALAISGRATPLDVEVGTYAASGVLHPDGTPYRSEQMPLARSLLAGEVVLGEEILIPRPDATTVPVLFSSAPLRDGAGAITGGVAVYQDISALRELDRQKDAFLAGVSHDLKNPLMAIRGQSQLMRRRITRSGSANTQQTVDGLAEIEASTDRVTAMLNELLDVTRLQMGRPLDLERGPVDLVALTQRLAEEYQQATGEHRLRVETDAADLVGDWDGPRLRRVLENLLSNAIKYSPDGGEIRIEVGRREQEGSDWAALTVRDRGLGIPAEDLPRVFERFHRGSNVRGQVAGTGLGLSGARQIVEQHGGTIAVDSREREGTTVTVRLPLAVSQESPATKEPGEG